MSRDGLNGLRILLTRARAQSLAIADLIREHAGTPVPAPCLDVVGLGADTELDSALKHCAGADYVIFISANAVKFADALVPLAGLQLGCVLAPGKGTAGALRAAGVDRVVTPTAGNDSDALLALAELQDVCDKQICIVRGQGGRERLRDKLVGRGAVVDYVEVYRREAPASIRVDVQSALTEGVDAVVVGSGETLLNLVDSVDEKSLSASLRALPLFVPSRRVAEMAGTRGFTRTIITESPDDIGVIGSLLEWAANSRAAESHER